MTERVDAIVVGMGVGGEEVAERLSKAGLAVVGIENGLVGGECPYWGCVPSKMMIRAGNLVAEARRVPKLAGEAEVRPDWTPVARRIREQATDNWDDRVAVERFEQAGGRFIRGRGELIGPRRVQVAETVFEARRAVVVATGTVPVIPPIEGLKGTPFWTNREAIEVESLPRSLIVLGGGAIGVELAQVFARFGVSVTVVEGGQRVLAMEEPESSEVAHAALSADGVTMLTGVRAERVSHTADAGFSVGLSNGTVVSAERLLVATGRRTDLKGLGLETVGLDPAGRSIEVDDRMRAADGVWAVGDATGKGAFTHIAMYQAGIAIRDILAEEGPAADYRALPRVTFIDPEIGAVGLTETQARDQGINVRVGSAQTSSSSRGWIHGPGNAGFIKLVTDADEGVLVGATAAGPAGGEVLGALSVAIHGRVPVERLRHMVFAYPTFHRGISDALTDL